MSANPYHPPRECPDPASTGGDRSLLVLGGVLAGINLFTFLSQGIREILVYFDPAPALALYLGGYVAGMVLIPLWAGRRGTRWIAAALVLLEIPWLFNVFVAAFCRGPNWNFYWPWEERDPFRVNMTNNIDLSQYFWHWLGFAARPAAALLRESPGFVLLGLWLFAIPWAVTRMLRRQLPAESPGYWRLLAMTFLLQWMALLPLKMLLRTLFNLKYIVSIPEVMLNV